MKAVAIVKAVLAAGLCVFVIVAAYRLPAMIGSFIKDELPDAPDIAGAAEDAGRRLKEYADTNSRELPLVVDPTDAIMGELEGLEAFGRAERQVIVAYAVKPYQGFGGEDIELFDGVFGGSAYVPGPLKVSVFQSGFGHDITVTVGTPAWSGDPEVATVPRTENDASFLREAGQFLGSATDPSAAQNELLDYVRTRIAGDQDLFDTASCWGGQSVRTLLTEVLAGIGQTEGTPVGPLASEEYRLRIQYEQYRPAGNANMVLPLSEERCEELLADSDISGEGTSRLPAHFVPEVGLMEA